MCVLFGVFGWVGLLFVVGFYCLFLKVLLVLLFIPVPDRVKLGELCDKGCGHYRNCCSDIAKCGFTLLLPKIFLLHLL